MNYVIAPHIQQALQSGVCQFVGVMLSFLTELKMSKCCTVQILSLKKKCLVWKCPYLAPALRSIIVSFTSLFGCLAHNLNVLVHSHRCFQWKGLKTHYTLPAQHPTADIVNIVEHLAASDQDISLRDQKLLLNVTVLHAGINAFQNLWLLWNVTLTLKPCQMKCIHRNEVQKHNINYLCEASQKEHCVLE